MTTLHEAVKVIADSVEKLAFEMPAPNPYTPRFVMLVIALRSALAQQWEQQPVAYLRQDGKHVVLANDLKHYPASHRFSIPLYAGAAPAPHPDTRKVIEQMVEALTVEEAACAYEHIEVPEHLKTAIQAGQKWLKENK